MSYSIIVVIALGVALGRFGLPSSFFSYTGWVIDLGLCLLLFLVGIEIGFNKESLTRVKKIGFKLILIPIMIILGSILGSILGGIVIGMEYNEAGAVGAGLGWYSLSSVLLSSYSTELAALAFMSNVIREIIAFISIPLIVKYIGDLESIAPAGATAMDTSLPIITKATNASISIIAFVTGVILSSAVPVLVPILINL
ncbi:membrane protein [Caloranaerobacter sp. TR13]|uniref:lysine exporter LysO family protein n=1 Tax=Caloranaerobacter sp. TR13 TaxID=1302151 RepID=UPI0006D40D6D|nr:lysine exporter LysO family protein [Caloranaerobacter sp. TR13]KPU28054.1 membrane protein [Caloranaerobacter sp. TR13]